MSKSLTLEEHLKLCAERSKTFTNEKLVEFNGAVVAAMEEIISALKKLNDDTSKALKFFEASGLYIDDNGNIAQKKQEEKNG